MGNELDAIAVQEVSLRDGLQRLSSIAPTDHKKRWINTAYSAGVHHMELASFGVSGDHCLMHPAWIGWAEAVPPAIRSPETGH